MKNLSLSIFYKENKFKRYLKLVFNKFINRSTQYGPDVVFLNLTNGLKKMNIKFLINPKYNRTFQHCIVLNDPATLKKLIDLKKNYNFKIYAGPNLMILSNEYDKILYRSEINKIIVPSKWIKKKYIEVSNNLIKNKIIIWGSGVDHEKWLPGKEKKYDFLIYSKHIRSKNLLQKCIKYLIKNNFTYKLLKYGYYSETHFKKYLSKSKKAIFFSESESQGMAYFES